MSGRGFITYRLFVITLPRVKGGGFFHSSGKTEGNFSTIYPHKMGTIRRQFGDKMPLKRPPLAHLYSFAIMRRCRKEGRLEEVSLSILSSGAVMPWLLGVLGLAILLSLTKSLRLWRHTKRSPYFFMRQQAQRSLQFQLWVTVGLILMALTVAYFVEPPPVDTTPKSAILANAKPVPTPEEEETDSGLPAGITVIPYNSPTTVDISVLSTPEASVATTSTLPAGLAAELGGSVAQAAIFNTTPTLPSEYDQFEPTAELKPDTRFTSLTFSTEIDSEYNPVSPSRVFSEGFFTVYATFYYEAMEDGMEWAWIWRHNGEIVNGGNEIWNYGSEGPGWIYYQPPEGFQAGEYTLEVWVNGELFGQSSITVERSVANQ